MQSIELTIKFAPETLEILKSLLAAVRGEAKDEDMMIVAEPSTPEEKAAVKGLSRLGIQTSARFKRKPYDSSKQVTQRAIKCVADSGEAGITGREVIAAVCSQLKATGIEANRIYSQVCTALRQATGKKVHVEGSGLVNARFWATTQGREYVKKIKIAA